MRARITRVVSNGDPVSMSILQGQIENGKANSYSRQRDEKGMLNFINNHKLKTESEMQGKAAKGTFVGAFNNDAAANAQAREGVTQEKDLTFGQRLNKVLEKSVYVKSGSNFANGIRGVAETRVNRIVHAKDKLLTKLGLKKADPNAPTEMSKAKYEATQDWNRRMVGRSKEEGPILTEPRKIFREEPGFFGGLARKLGIVKKPTAKVRSDAEIEDIKRRWAESRQRVRSGTPLSRESSIEIRRKQQKLLDAKVEKIKAFQDQRIAKFGDLQERKRIEFEKERRSLNMALNRKKRTYEQEEAIQKRWDESRARAAARKKALVSAGQNQARPKKTRSAEQVAAIQKRWNESRARARASAATRQGYQARPKKTRSAEQVAAIQKRWNESRARARASAATRQGYQARPKPRKVRSAAQIASIKARWAARKARRT